MPRRQRFALRPTLDIMETRLAPSRAGSLVHAAMMIGDQNVAHVRRSQLIVGVNTRHTVHSKDSTNLLTSVSNSVSNFFKSTFGKL
jgi:hypothetical protein